MGGYADLRPSRAGSWQTLPLAAGWEQFDSSGVYLPRYKRDGDAVFVTGAARTNVANSSSGYITIATLPAEVKPDYLSTHPYVVTSSGAIALIVNGSGNIMINGPLPVNWTIWLTMTFAV